MDEELQGVNPESPTGDLESVSEETTQPQDNSEQSQEEQTPAVGSMQQYDPNLYDDRGVPWKNVAMENARKAEQARKTQEEILSRLDSLKPASQEQEYSITDLQVFADSTDNQSHKLWALQQIEKKRQEENTKLVTSELQKYQQKQQLEQVKQKTFQSVISRNPDLIIRDNAGNFVGWNNRSPLLSAINRYMANPEIGGHPQGLEMAEALAVRDLHYSSKGQTQQTVQTLKRANKVLQQKTLVEGGGVVARETANPVKDAINRVKQTGSIKDAEEALIQMRKRQREQT